MCEREVTGMECPIGGLPKCPKFIRIGDTFGGCWLLLILMMVSTQKDVQLIIESLLYTSMHYGLSPIEKWDIKNFAK